jgi:hypothetical protein
MELENLEDLVKEASGEGEKKVLVSKKTDDDDVLNDKEFENELESFDTKKGEPVETKNISKSSSSIFSLEKIKEELAEEKEENKDKPKENTVANLLGMDKDRPKTKKRDVKIIKHEKKKKIPVVLDKPTGNKAVLVPSGGGFISAACTLDEAIATFELFEEAKKRILKDTDVIWIGPNGRPVEKDQGGSPHIKRSGWCRLARFFRVSWKVISNDGSPMLSTDKDGNSKGYIYRAIVQGTHPSGASVTQSGFATSTDPFFTKGGRKDADEEDVAMKAETVGISRVVSNILGSGEVSAEEIINE